MKTRLIKQDITVTTDEEVMRVLLDGYVIEDIGDSSLLKLTDGSFLWLYEDGTSVPYALGDALVSTLEVYKEEEVPWYENIPEQGILCWLSDVSPEVKSCFGKVFSKDKEGFTASVSFKYATPMTLEEIKQYILEEVNHG